MTTIHDTALTATNFDEQGRCTIGDSTAAEVITAGMGYATRPAFIMVDGKRRCGTVTFGRYGSHVTIEALARK